MKLDNYYITNEWGQFIGKCNWYTFTPIRLRVEHKRYWGSFGFEFILLGLGIYLEFHYKDTEAYVKFQKRCEDGTMLDWLNEDKEDVH